MDHRSEEIRKNLFEQVAHIAAKFGWTESEILRLPQTRRLEYVSQINKMNMRESGKESEDFEEG